MPVTSRTRSESTIFLLEARIERQYDTKNCRKITAEATQMAAAIIALSPLTAQAPDGRRPERVRTYRPTPVAATLPPKAETSAESSVPVLGKDCAARTCKRRR